MTDLYTPPCDETPGIPHHIRYRFRGGETIASARCAGCRQHWSEDDEGGFVEWFRGHESCSELLPS